MSDFFNVEAITEDFMSFKGFDINTSSSRRKAISWLERVSGNDMFFSPPQGWSESEPEIDNLIGEMRRGVMLDDLKGVE